MEQQALIDSFNKMVAAEPQRKGKPRLATPKEMKSIWKTVENQNCERTPRRVGSVISCLNWVVKNTTYS